MSFISKIRNSNDKPLDEYSKFNFNDTLNNIYIIDDLREKGRHDDAKKAFKSFINHGMKLTRYDENVAAFLNYLSEISQIDNNIIKTNKYNFSKDNINKKLSDTEKLTSSIIIQEYKDSKYSIELDYEKLEKFLDISHGRKVPLNKQEYGLLSGMIEQTSSTYVNITKQIVNDYPIPEVNHVKDIYDTPDLSKLYDEYSKDKYFKSNYKIKNIYEFSGNEQSKNASKQGKNKITLNTGTGNESLIKILNGGFKKPSELHAGSGAKISGQMFGDAVYFARPNQISKNTSYVDRTNPGSKFIIVADVYYDDKKKVKRAGQYRYNGHNLVQAVDIGAYSRDEYMCSPEQIEVKYILEVTRGQLKKPKQIYKSINSFKNVNNHSSKDKSASNMQDTKATISNTNIKNSQSASNTKDTKATISNTNIKNSQSTSITKDTKATISNTNIKNSQLASNTKDTKTLISNTQNSQSTSITKDTKSTNQSKQTFEQLSLDLDGLDDQVVANK